MRTFITDIFPKIQSYSQKLDNLTLLTNKHWVSIDNIINYKTVYIFRDNNELLVSTNGKVEKAKWEYLGNKALLIDKKNESFLFKHGFFDQNIFALKVDSSNEYAVFVNENNYDGDLNSMEKVIDFLNEKYLDPKYKSTVGEPSVNSYKKADYEKYVPKVSIEEQNRLDEQSQKEESQFRMWIVIVGVILLTVFILGIVLVNR